MDPQRQYAQLLPLWAQGNKILRRKWNGQLHARELEAWQLGQSLASHKMGILPMRLDPILFLVADHPEDPSAWFLLAGEDLGPGEAQWFRRAVYLRWGPDSVWRYSQTWTVPAHDARHLGPGQWRTMREWIGRGRGAAEWPSGTQPQDVLAGLSHEPLRIGQEPVSLWLALSQLWRHRGTWCQAAQLQPADYPWLRYDSGSGKFLWPHGGG